MKVLVIVKNSSHPPTVGWLLADRLLTSSWQEEKTSLKHFKLKQEATLARSPKRTFSLFESPCNLLRAVMLTVGGCERSTVGRLSAVCRPTVSHLSGDSWPTYGRQSTNSWPLMSTNSRWTWAVLHNYQSFWDDQLFSKPVMLSSSFIVMFLGLGCPYRSSYLLPWPPPWLCEICIILSR